MVLPRLAPAVPRGRGVDLPARRPGGPPTDLPIRVRASRQVQAGGTHPPGPAGPRRYGRTLRWPAKTAGRAGPASRYAPAVTWSPQATTQVAFQQPGRQDDVRNGIHHLFIPGPTNIPESVRRAMNVPMQDHRAPDFPELTMPLFAGLKKIFVTESGRVFVYPSSGTGAWEAAIPTPSTGRPGADVALRPALAPVGRDGAAARPRRHLRGRRVVGGGAPRGVRAPAHRGQVAGGTSTFRHDTRRSWLNCYRSGNDEARPIRSDQ